MSNGKGTIAVLTSGGDAPGMNAAIRAVVRTAIYNDYKVFGVQKGYNGLIDDNFIELDAGSVSDRIDKGGTFLYTARSPRFIEPKHQKEAADMCRKHGIEAVVIIGGDGSYRGAAELAGYGLNVITIPATIDLDISSTDYTIGFDTAVNTAMSAIDKVRDTSTSHERCSIIEVMGRHAGYIALACGIANGAEDILLPETYGYDEEVLVQHIVESRQRGKRHCIVINAEGVGHSSGMAKRIEKATGVNTRATVLGHLQRGGVPTARDRVIASLMGSYAVELIIRGSRSRAVAWRNGGITDYDLVEAINMEKQIDSFGIKVSKVLSI